MPIKAVNHYRRTLLKGFGAATLLSPLASLPSFAAEQRRIYVDGLSFLPDDLSDVTASKLDAYVCDISAIETIEQADGTQNYKRTYKACMESIQQAAKRVSASPDILLQGLRGRDIQRARDSKRTAVFFQIQGADCVEADSDANQWARVDEFHQQGLRVLQLTHHYGNTFAGAR
ncbi:Membrane dipeptidase (Peptidase family M19) [Shewanella morhuae]|uniref:Membrane dipeptidase (Peptidase family M19) n=1 Tax=Shewanella morhuae TaxID=365591 RepID=A0A380C782_9GAMM|nr:Membrane dipeptidase (Peptidase family M19) [Shewanella morhuae]